MTVWEWEGLGILKAIPAHLYLEGAKKPPQKLIIPHAWIRVRYKSYVRRMSYMTFACMQQTAK